MAGCISGAVVNLWPSGSGTGRQDSCRPHCRTLPSRSKLEGSREAALLGSDRFSSVVCVVSEDGEQTSPCSP